MLMLFSSGEHQASKVAEGGEAVSIVQYRLNNVCDQENLMTKENENINSKTSI